VYLNCGATCFWFAATPSATFDGDFTFLIDALAFVSGRPNMAKYTECAPFFVRLDQVRSRQYAYRVMDVECKFSSASIVLLLPCSFRNC
jgi:hypothetical protein